MKRLYSEKIKKMVTFYFICILLLVHHESVYCESSSTTATSDTRNTIDAAGTTDKRITEYYLKLEHGKHGWVEIKILNTTDYLCSHTFTDADATVVCREIGYKGGFAYILPDYYRDVYHGMLSLGCNGTEEIIRDCSNLTYASNCRPAAAYCFNNSGFDFRLVNISTSGYGHLEMALDGEWRPVCAWDTIDNNQIVLDLLCQYMGFSNGTSAPRVEKNPVEKFWLPYMCGCRKGGNLLSSCSVVLNDDEVPYNRVEWRNNRYIRRYYQCLRLLPLIKCF
uniref:Scavenger receptor cysteine-rich protein 2 n=1 Tax=Sinohyriopsis cumingii TaxID=165450 RepID=R4UY41_SINCU|nr:scavenger receptor cysteine-rich protein 2 [Sinohyriopsis cumingii]